MREQDLRISIENAASTLYNADRAADVEHALKVFGHGARCVEDLAASDLDAVFGELHQRLSDLDD